ncbi:hypothetical protein [Bacillus badius]|uniref:hypothetical protein n=1 Tax=Bacillus badius TaxID=1455 RepID=UPI0007B35200|nr:hypothetical protein [Bacillus badius]KZR59367.1 hypothetical protein A3781_13275 [Bacillus badius]
MNTDTEKVVVISAFYKGEQYYEVWKNHSNFLKTKDIKKAYELAETFTEKEKIIFGERGIFEIHLNGQHITTFLTNIEALDFCEKYKNQIGKEDRMDIRMIYCTLKGKVDEPFNPKKFNPQPLFQTSYPEPFQQQ